MTMYEGKQYHGSNFWYSHDFFIRGVWVDLFDEGYLVLDPETWNWFFCTEFLGPGIWQGSNDARLDIFKNPDALNEHIHFLGEEKTA